MLKIFSVFRCSGRIHNKNYIYSNIAYDLIGNRQIETNLKRGNRK